MLAKQELKVYNLLTSGGKYTVLDIVMHTRIADPRSVIRCLRNSGIIVCDEWEEGNDSRYKRYWINTNNPQKTPQP